MAGYMALVVKIIVSLRCLVVNTTKGMNGPYSTSVRQKLNSSASLSETALATASGTPSMGFQDTTYLEEDQPELRKKYRRTFGLVELLAIAPVVIAPIMASKYVDAEEGEGKAGSVGVLRSADCALLLACN